MNTSIYDYKNNIKITTTPNGDKVITMNEAILTKLCNDIFEAQMAQQNRGLEATAKDTNELWQALAHEVGE